MCVPYYTLHIPDCIYKKKWVVFENILQLSQLIFLCLCPVLVSGSFTIDKYFSLPLEELKKQLTENVGITLHKIHTNTKLSKTAKKILVIRTATVACT